jgi:hypothetical protein
MRGKCASGDAERTREKYTRVLFTCNVRSCGCGLLLFLAEKVRRAFLIEEKVRHDLFELLIFIP